VSQAAGTVLVCAVEGTALSAEEQEFFRRVPTSGVTLFGRNIPASYQDVRGLAQALSALRPPGAPPLVIAIDQEGGRVARFKTPALNPGPAMKLAGGRDDAEALAAIQQVALTIGRELLALGFNVDFAPVLDVLTEPTNTAIGDRAFGTTVTAVSRRGGAFLKGLQESGVLGCLKHFPGQGDAKVDTHEGAAIIDAPLSMLKARELAPFAEHLAQAPMVMISHCIYPALAPEEASRSPRIMEDLLRRELGFKGVIVSDDMTMGAMPGDLAPWKDAIVAAVAGGSDMILVCRHVHKCWAAYEALAAEAARSQTFARRLDEAAARVMSLRRRL
jgi:beta-N-acetylhexosaminidase